MLLSDNKASTLSDTHNSIYERSPCKVCFRGKIFLPQVRLSISQISTSSAVDKPAFWLEGGIHANEWIAPATVLYIAGQVSLHHTHTRVFIKSDFDYVTVPDIRLFPVCLFLSSILSLIYLYMCLSL